MINNDMTINDILKYVKNNWSDWKVWFPYIGNGKYAIPELTPEVERDILALALLGAYEHISGKICEKIKDGDEYCPDFFEQDPNPCMGCKLYWLIGQGAKQWVEQKKSEQKQG